MSEPSEQAPGPVGRVLVCVPPYNERDNLPLIVRRIRAAVHDWQRTHGLAVRDLWTRGAWKTLWAANRHPILKRGSAGDQVRDLPRALNSTTRTEERVKVTGVLDWNTHVGLVAYQRRLGRTTNGMATAVTWSDLAHAR